MAKVLFNETVTTREARPQTFVAGEVYDLPEASANRWVIRGKAERVYVPPQPVPVTFNSAGDRLDPPPSLTPTLVASKPKPAARTRPGDGPPAVASVSSDTSGAVVLVPPTPVA